MAGAGSGREDDRIRRAPRTGRVSRIRVLPSRSVAAKYSSMPRREGATPISVSGTESEKIPDVGELESAVDRTDVPPAKAVRAEV